MWDTQVGGKALGSPIATNGYLATFERMESHIIFTASSHLKNKVVWNDWIYCGLGYELRKEEVRKFLREYLGVSTYYMVKDRKKSAEVDVKIVLLELESELEKADHLIWNLTFEKVIEFYRIGVMRSGTIKLPL